MEASQGKVGRQMSMTDIKISYPTDTVMKIYTEISTAIGDNQFTAANAIGIVVNLMQLAGQYPKLSGVQRKAIVVDVVNRLIDERSNDEETKAQLKFLIQTLISPLIDTIISIDNKEIRIALEKGCKRAFPCCFSSQALNSKE